MPSVTGAKVQPSRGPRWPTLSQCLRHLSSRSRRVRFGTGRLSPMLENHGSNRRSTRSPRPIAPACSFTPRQFQEGPRNPAAFPSHPLVPREPRAPWWRKTNLVFWFPVRDVPPVERSHDGDGGRVSNRVAGFISNQVLRGKQKAPSFRGEGRRGGQQREARGGATTGCQDRRSIIGKEKVRRGNEDTAGINSRTFYTFLVLPTVTRHLDQVGHDVRTRGELAN